MGFRTSKYADSCWVQSANVNQSLTKKFHFLNIFSFSLSIDMSSKWASLSRTLHSLAPNSSFFNRMGENYVMHTSSSKSMWFYKRWYGHKMYSWLNQRKRLLVSLLYIYTDNRLLLVNGLKQNAKLTVRELKVNESGRS